MMLDQPLPMRRGARPLLAPEEASNLVDNVLETMQSLELVLGEETDLIKAGKLTEAMVHEPRKSELATAYMQGLESVKANVLTLARVAPERITALKDAHSRFSEIIGINQAALATARAVAEGLLRTLSSEMSNQVGGGNYAPPSNKQATMPSVAAGRSSSLVVSKSV
jgi:hypothetical protein